MSLDVYLETQMDDNRTKLLFSANYTHNCNTMAHVAGLYYPVWRPDEIDINFAHQLIPYLRKGIAEMERDPKKFVALNPSNGWGSYDTFLPWLKNYLQACEKYPKAFVLADR